MDAKVLAKSKRAHSQHHKNKSYPNQKPKGTLAASDGASSKKSSGKQFREKEHQSNRTAKLPSNWDRYEDEADLEFEKDSGNSSSKASDVIVPKSKGADYHFLLTEALSQAQSQSNLNLDSLDCWDDILPGGFIQDIGPMLSVRGESISSWAGADNFVVEDKKVIVQEESFLSLDLNSLAEQLSKVDLPQRLFVEADLLSSEQDLHVPMAISNQVSDQIQMTDEGDSNASISGETASNEVPVNEPDARGFNQEPGSTDYMNLTKLVTNTGQSVATQKDNTVAASDINFPKFEAAAVEAELDMLLDSFDDSKSLGFSEQAGSSKKDPDLPKTLSGAASFDILDDLLQGTTSLKKPIAVIEPHEDQPSTKPNDLDDFDSWLDSF